MLGDTKHKKPIFFIKDFFLTIVPKNVFLFFFYNLKKGKDISILWSAYYVINIIYCIIQAVKHYINCIYDSWGSYSQWGETGWWQW